MVVQRAMAVAGAILVAVWIVAWIHGRVASRGDVARFEAARDARVEIAPPAVVELEPSPAVDTSLWSAGRLERYRESLERELDLPLGVLRIPSIGLVVPVHAGTDELTLNRAVGWIESTSAPGANGNIALAGHRDGFFRGLKDLRLGASIELETLDGAREYEVEELLVVDPADVEVLAPRKVPTLTLVTCFPFYFVGKAPQRFIVHAALRPELPLAGTDAGFADESPR